MLELIGIFAPNGELEAVEFSPAMAEDARANLSPDKKNPNRKLGPVTVINGDIGKAIAMIFMAATDGAVGKALAEYERATKAATVTGKDDKPVLMANNRYLEAKSKLFAALSVREGLQL